MKYYIGIDGGGTKTAFVCYDEANNLVASCVRPSCHILQVDDEKAVSILRSGIEELLDLAKIKGEAYICAGLAGYGKNISLRQRIENNAHCAFKGHPYILRNDGEIALAGALDGDDGILVIAGTGSIAIASKGDIAYRCGGWGYMIGDEGSAYWIAKKLLSAYTRQCDNRQPKSLLYAYLYEKWQFHDDYDVIPFVADKLQNKRDAIAGLAVCAYELAMMNDPEALHIYEEAALALAQLVNALAINFPGKVKASYAGGVWHAKDILMPMIKKHLVENIEFIDPHRLPVDGASLLAKHYFSQNRKK